MADNKYDWEKLKEGQLGYKSSLNISDTSLEEKSNVPDLVIDKRSGLGGGWNSGKSKKVVGSSGNGLNSCYSADVVAKYLCVF